MPTRRGLLLVPVGIVLTLAGVAWGVEEFVLVALAALAALIGALAVVAVSGRWAQRSLQVEVQAPSTELAVGAPATVVLSVLNTGAVSLSDLWLDANGDWEVSLPGLAGAAVGIGARLAAPPVQTGQTQVRRARRTPIRSPGTRVPAHGRLTVPSLAPGERWTTTLPVPTQRRGLWSLSPQVVWCADPFGLWARQVARSPSLHVVVCPVPAPEGRPAPVSASLGGRHATVEAHGHTRRARGGGDELAGLRRYIAGDRLNRLHWPALARTGELVVREFVEPEAPCLEVFVDDRPAVVEGAVSSAARLGIDALAEGTSVDLLTGSGERLTLVPGPASRRALLEALAVVAPVERWRR